MDDNLIFVIRLHRAESVWPVSILLFCVCLEEEQSSDWFSGSLLATVGWEGSSA